MLCKHCGHEVRRDIEPLNVCDACIQARIRAKIAAGTLPHPDDPGLRRVDPQA